MKPTHSLLAALLFTTPFAHPTHAAILDRVTISGKVQNIAEARGGQPGYVELKTELGTVVKIPRDAIDEAKLNLRPGKDAQIVVSLKRVVAFNAQAQGKAAAKTSLRR